MNSFVILVISFVSRSGGARSCKGGKGTVKEVVVLAAITVVVGKGPTFA